MWTRKELKEKAKSSIKPCYWKAVLASLILGIATGGSSGASAGNQAQQASSENSNMQEFFSNPIVIIGIIVGILVAIAVSLAIKVFAFNPLSVGGYKYFVDNSSDSEHPNDLGVLGFGFKNNYKNNVLVIFMTNLYIFLWTLLLIVPGVIKSYAYRMVPYILGDNPDISYKEALAMSEEMMMGQKWNAFVLDLSFILWHLLSGITLGIVGVFYVGPYVNFTNAELYLALKNN